MIIAPASLGTMVSGAMIDVVIGWARATLIRAQSNSGGAFAGLRHGRVRFKIPTWHGTSWQQSKATQSANSSQRCQRSAWPERSADSLPSLVGLEGRS